MLLADDDAAFREQLETTLANRVPGIEIVGSVADGHTAVAAAMDTSPAVVLIDYAMPGPSGGHAATVISQALPATRVVILTGLDAGDLDDVVNGFEIVHKGPGMEEELVGVLRRQP